MFASRYFPDRYFAPYYWAKVGATPTLFYLYAPVVAGKTYAFKARLYVTADATGGHKYAMGGTCTATAIVYEILSIDNATKAFVITSKKTALGQSAGQAGATDVYTEIDGTITVNASGNLTVQFALNAASGSSSITALSTLEVAQTL